MSATFAILLSALAMTLIVGVRYMASSGGFAWLTSRVRPGLYTELRPQIGREIYWSLLSAAIYGIPAGVVAWGWDNHGWTLIYTDIAAWPLWYWPLSILAYLFAHDTWFYWTHRLMHRPRWFRIAHAVHHASRPPTAWAAMSFHPIEALTGAVVIPALVFLIPIHIAALAVVLTVMTIMGVTNHMGWEVFPRFIVQGVAGRWLITASHHQRHHTDYRCNYGLYFRLWDRLCGTDKGLGSFVSEGGGGTGPLRDAVGGEPGRAA
ncbi:MAG: sterol desaturase family protein [Sphingomonadaceae bacterium]|nr:sterol desaturase family protein [Sphingomonadaceae bacterium]